MRYYWYSQSIHSVCRSIFFPFQDRLKIFNHIWSATISPPFMSMKKVAYTIFVIKKICVQAMARVHIAIQSPEFNQLCLPSCCLSQAVANQKDAWRFTNEAPYPVLHPEDGPQNYLGSVGCLANCHHDLSKVYMHLSLKSTLFLPKHHPGSDIQKGERGNQVE